ncbi:ABC transporter substrate-binding protein [Aureimonas fodinaquatilis]|uniref:ABC transporter substrate-binding protein n=2 Tax=Aureimonas fodinaquatilis TaxID=2565783 RepID=A0A5B0DV55_9HYPH|nr:ABC transporter substrate-binding protein [Aureimonas fodinaquatilis]
MAATALGLMTHGASAEVSTIRAAQQYGLSSLPLIIMEDQKLVEKHSEALGSPVTVEWVQLGGPGAMNEAIVSGDLDFGSAGMPSLLTLWDRTKGTRREVRGIGAVIEMPMDLMTTNPDVKSIADFKENDKIAVTTIKVSNQALLLQMAAAAEFGDENYEQLDPLTVSLPHPEATSMLLSGGGVITAHFSALPFQFAQAKADGVHTVTSSYDILGGPATNVAAFTTSQFRDANPNAYKAFVGALNEAAGIINADKRAAAETFKRVSNSQESVEDIQAMLDDPRVAITTTPRQTLKIAQFMHQIGRLKTDPQNVQDYFFEDVSLEGGS